LACVCEAPLDVITSLIDAHPLSTRITDERWDRLPLHFACIKNRPVSTVRLLIKSNPYGVKFRDKQHRMPIHYACVWGDVRMVRLLLEAFPESLNAVDEAGKTPLEITRLSGNPNKMKICEELERALRARLDNITTGLRPASQAMELPHLSQHLSASYYTSRTRETQLPATTLRTATTGGVIHNHDKTRNSELFGGCNLDPIDFFNSNSSSIGKTMTDPFASTTFTEPDKLLNQSDAILSVLVSEQEELLKKQEKMNELMQEFQQAKTKKAELECFDPVEVDTTSDLRHEIRNLMNKNKSLKSELKILNNAIEENEKQIARAKDDLIREKRKNRISKVNSTSLDEAIFNYKKEIDELGKTIAESTKLVEELREELNLIRPLSASTPAGELGERISIQELEGMQERMDKDFDDCNHLYPY